MYLKSVGCGQKGVGCWYVQLHTIDLAAILRGAGAERDFRDQKGRLQEEVEAPGRRVLSYPKFHCELDFIERYWCRAKWLARGNCGYCTTLEH